MAGGKLHPPGSKRQEPQQCARLGPLSQRVPMLSAGAHPAQKCCPGTCSPAGPFLFCQPVSRRGCLPGPCSPPLPVLGESERCCGKNHTSEELGLWLSPLYLFCVPTQPAEGLQSGLPVIDFFPLLLHLRLPASGGLGRTRYSSIKCHLLPLLQQRCVPQLQGDCGSSPRAGSRQILDCDFRFRPVVCSVCLE